MKNGKERRREEEEIGTGGREDLEEAVFKIKLICRSILSSFFFLSSFRVFVIW
jgi:hypothetical protein